MTWNNVNALQMIEQENFMNYISIGLALVLLQWTTVKSLICYIKLYKKRFFACLFLPFFFTFISVFRQHDESLLSKKKARSEKLPDRQEMGEMYNK